MSIDPKVKATLKDKYKDEQVYVIPFDKVKSIPDKFTRIQHTKDVWKLIDNNGQYAFRSDVEGEPIFQQPIPYIVVQNPENNKFFVSKRITGEERLIGNLSLGFGGHINPCDGIQEILFKALVRELNEELYIDPLSSAEHIGTVRGLTSSTNDHIGFVFLIKATKVDIKEKDGMVGEWMSLQDLEIRYYKLEDWSKHIVDYLVTNGTF